MFSPADAIRFKALEKDVANLRTLIRIEALDKENANLRYVHRGRGGRGGRRGAANSNEQEPRLCVVCGTAEHLAEGCPDAHPTAVARIKKRDLWPLRRQICVIDVLALPESRGREGWQQGWGR